MKTTLRSFRLSLTAQRFDRITVSSGLEILLRKKRPAVTAQQGCIHRCNGASQLDKSDLPVLLFVTLLPQTLFAFVGRHFMTFSLLTTRHCALRYLF